MSCDLPGFKTATIGSDVITLRPQLVQKASCLSLRNTLLASPPVCKVLMKLACYLWKSIGGSRLDPVSSASLLPRVGADATVALLGVTAGLGEEPRESTGAVRVAGLIGSTSEGQTGAVMIRGERLC